MIRSLVVVLLMATTAAAEAGPSYLGICSPTWNCTATIQSYKGQPSIVTGWLENTFAADCACGDRILQLPQEKIGRWHIANGPCLRNRRCGKYEIFAGLSVERANRKVGRRDGVLLKKFRTVTLRLKRRLEAAKGGLTCYVSPCLECDLRDSNRRTLGSIVSKYLPYCTLVDSTYREECLRGSVCEFHGDEPKVTNPCIADLDGVDGKVVDLRQYRRDTLSCDLRYYWEPWYNCIRSAKFVDPRARDCRYPGSKFRETGKRLWRLS
jgi:hypothetical protein